MTLVARLTFEDFFQHGLTLPYALYLRPHFFCEGSLNYHSCLQLV